MLANFYPKLPSFNSLLICVIALLILMGIQLA